MLLCCKRFALSRFVVVVFGFCSLFSSQVWGDEVIYVYDGMDRLVRTEHVGTANIDYTYDALGNILSVTQHNELASLPPTVPVTISPLDLAIDVPPQTAILEWSSSDPDAGDLLYYDLYLGRTNPPSLYKSGLASSAFSLSGLNSIDTYYWKIVARDNHNAVTEGPVWSFTTGNTPPPAPVNPFPTNNSDTSYVGLTLRWDAVTDPDPDDSITYDVYFGLAADPALVLADYAGTSYTPASLDPWQTYYWKVVAKDNNGAVSQSVVWAFHPLDSDGDGFPDDVENTLCISSSNPDTDADGLSDSQEDVNLNGVLDAGETSPCNRDTDGDLMPDGWEIANSLDPLVNDALLDLDGDGASNLEEYLANTDVTDSTSVPLPNAIYEDFEQGDFAALYPIAGGNVPWSVTTSRAQSGLNAAETGNITDNQISRLETIVNTVDGTMSFAVSASSQANYDVLNFYIDDVLQGTWSGDVAFEQVYFPVTAGVHRFTWEYTKNSYYSALQDTVWIDDVYIPGLYDEDADGIADSWEYHYFDTLTHDMALDTDGDGLTELQEWQLQSDPLAADTDGDQMPDGWEAANGTQVLVADGGADDDGDGFTNLTEYVQGTDPQDALSVPALVFADVDTDGDSMPDLWESANGLDPLVADGDLDLDADGFTNVTEYVYGTNPQDAAAVPVLYVNDFETGKLAGRFWIQGGNAPWFVSTDRFQSGAYAAQSGAIDHSQTSSLETIANTIAGNISFGVSISSQSYYDKLRFYIDDVLKGTWSGELAFTAVSYSVTQGVHRFKWEYSKNGSTVAGSDAAWIDDVDIPGPVDADNNGIADSWEYFYFNGLYHDMSLDSDGDGLSDLEEGQLGLNPLSSDSDGDQMSDKWELDNALDPLAANGLEDADSDGFTNLTEFLQGTNPQDAASVPPLEFADVDSDGDEMPDVWESLYSLDPLVDDSRVDSDADGAINILEFEQGTNPQDALSAPLVAQFENPRLDGWYWIQTGDAQWFASAARVQAGTGAAESGHIADSQASVIETIVNTEAGNVWFGVSVSSQANADYLNFYIDDVLVGSWSGELAFEYEHFAVTAGLHRFKWEYAKNGSLNDGSDAVWIDNLFIPGPYDADSDGVADSWEYQFFAALDHDLSLDTDADGLSDLQEGQLWLNPSSADSDGDQLPDAWEVANALDPLSDDSAADADSDGFSNLVEFLQATDPQDALSVPALEFADVDSDGDTMPDAWENTYGLDPAVDDALNDLDGDNATNLLEFEQGTNPQDALNVPPVTDFESGGFGSTGTDGWYWVQGGNAPWFAGTDRVQTGTYAAQSGQIGNGQTSTVETIVNTVEGNVWFGLSVSSEQGYDYVKFYIDDVLQGYASGEMPFQWIHVPVTSGVHRFQWEYAKDGSVSAGSDTAWFDNVFIPGPYDEDLDGIADSWEYFYFSTLDHDMSLDTDSDGATDLVEGQLRLNPTVGDTDGDTMPDGWEVLYGLDPLSDDSTLDSDADGFTNLTEYQQATNPADSASVPPLEFADVDTDGDAMPDAWEVTYSLDPAVDDTLGDPDADGFSNLTEYLQVTNPQDALSTPALEFADIDADADQMLDAWELAYGLDPTVDDGYNDADGDYATNLLEFEQATDPQDALSLPPLIGFESGTLEGRYWVQGGAAPWSVSAAVVQSGAYAAASGAITDAQVSTLETAAKTANTSIWFGLSVSSEYQSDYFRFYVDDVLRFSGSGEVLFQSVAVPVSAGVHRFKWEYVKDAAGSSGDDVARIDNIFIPGAYDEDLDGLADSWEYYYFATLTHDMSLDTEGDGLTDLEEGQMQLNPLAADTDGDQMPDGWEVANALNPLLKDGANDNDADGFSNLAEFTQGTDPQDALSIPALEFADVDSEGDGMPDAWELLYSLDPTIDDSAVDSDADGFTNLTEYQQATSPQDVSSAPALEFADVDNEGDGMPDAWELAYGLDPAVDDSALDSDGDGYTNLTEYLQATSPQDSLSVPALEFADVDSEGDGMPDAWELAYGLDPAIDDSAVDSDGDGVGNLLEYLYGTDPQDAASVPEIASVDADGDGMPDDWELLNGLDATVDDSGLDPDGDGFTNLTEYLQATDPQDALSVPALEFADVDSEGDGMPDVWETTYGLDPAVDDSADDPDADGFTNIVEYEQHTDPQDPLSIPPLNFADIDSEGDGMPDAWENAYGLDPTVNDSFGDADFDGAANLLEFEQITSPIDGAEVPAMLGFENGVLDGVYWKSGGDAPWFVGSDRAHTGVYAAQSGVIADGQTSSLETAANTPGGYMWFGIATSSEYQSDYIYFYVDDVLRVSGSGEINFQPFGVYLTPGVHRFRWEFAKDAAGSGGSDAAWIDNVFISAPYDEDADGIADSWEYIYFAALDHDMSLDSDFDGLTDFEEGQLLINPTVADSDGDQMPDAWEVANSLNPASDDSAGDIDGDGFSNLTEYTQSTDPSDALSAPAIEFADVDAEGDGMLDAWELLYGLDPAIDDAGGDADGDGFSNLVEFQQQTDPQDPLSVPPLEFADVDSDGDLMPDLWELANGLDPAVADGSEDPDADGFSNLAEYRQQTDPQDPLSVPALEFADIDSEGDGMPDAWELYYGLDTTTDDSDLDTDADGANNLTEYTYGTDPLDPASVPAIAFIDFEAGVFDGWLWIHGGNAPWFVNTVNVQDGVYAAQAGAITDSQSSTLETMVNTVAGNVSFGMAVSSELYYDFFKFYIDGVLQGSWSGEVPFQTVSFPVTAGIHSFKWEYVKDYIYGSGSDTAWIDNIDIPGVIDSDFDGIHDGWELFYFGVLDHDMSLDTDGDGVTDLDEYYAGTSPLA